MKHPDFPDDEFKVGMQAFKVEQEEPTPFADKETMPVCAPTAPRRRGGVSEAKAELRAEDSNSARGVTVPVGRGLSRAENAKLHAQGHTVDDDNESVEEEPVQPIPSPVGTWIIPETCPRVSAGHTKKSKVDQSFHGIDCGVRRAAAVPDGIPGEVFN